MPSPINLETAGDKYWHVKLGPIPDLPDWHEQSSWASYAFPTLASAEKFAEVHYAQEPGREIIIVPPAEND